MSILGFLFGWQDSPGGLADQARSLPHESVSPPTVRGCRDTCDGVPYPNFAREQASGQGWTRESLAAARQLEQDERIKLLTQFEQEDPILVDVRVPSGDWIAVPQGSIFARRS